MPAFANALCIGGLPVTSGLAERTLSVPMANDQTEADREHIMRVIRQAM